MFIIDKVFCEGLGNVFEMLFFCIGCFLEYLFFGCFVDDVNVYVFILMENGNVIFLDVLYWMRDKVVMKCVLEVVKNDYKVFVF